MDLYHSWLYQKIINTQWFMWTIVYVTLGINILAPAIVWFFNNYRRLFKKPADPSNKQSQPSGANGDE
ncbi:hypothetical protein [Paenibacillus kobensis]|uniref:hypothetical protein n=1 Tax=Paenibacillus kobensis TaxID=59841 RepID=UPI000FD9A56C|nr:hypothetical protein [Paenibacillus kobensis]